MNILQVALLVGVAGACRRKELTDMVIKDVKIEKDFVKLTIPTSKTHITRKFTIEGRFMDLIKKYCQIRPTDSRTDRFFLHIQDGKLTNKPIGKNTIGKMPKIVAEFLQLPNPASYTGHTFKRTSVTLLAEAGANSRQITRHTGHKNQQTSELYIDESMKSKRETSKKILRDSEDDEEPPTKKTKKDIGNNFNFCFNFNGLNINQSSEK